MKTYHMGGRLGDTIFALWTMRELGGGKLYLTDYHVSHWSLEIAETMREFLEYQDFIESVEIVPYASLPAVDYDLQNAEDATHAEQFPEWDGNPWPSNCNIVKRYAVHFGLTERYEWWRMAGSPAWLAAPDDERNDIAFHCPLRRSVRSEAEWMKVLARVATERIVCILNMEPLVPPSMPFLKMASVIKSSPLFLGGVSSGNALAEALGKPTLVEQAGGCFNVNPTLCLNGMSNETVVAAVVERLKR